jgi:very-short-patch-repair endonuclease
MNQNRLFNRKELLERRIQLRKNQTPQEVLLWEVLSNKKLGVKFRRQHSIGPYIVDFYCREKKLVIELDGSQHIKQKEYDRERDNFLKSHNITTIRFWNNQINESLDGVVMNILETIKQL